MTDAKELVERLDALAKYLDHIDASDKAQAVVDDARDWIKRWAPVVEAEIEFRRLDRDGNATRQERTAAGLRVEKAISTALGEDKP